ncbi:MAG TPA: metallophosphoesterase, partial [Chryseolinea sp.]|nr:metallophosphoesterase [Chryseolinea sp.]
MKSLSLQILLASALCFSVCRADGQSTASHITGHVFVDKNKNGLRDKNEQGLKDVIVSDQIQIATTNSDGAYTLMSTGHMGNIFVVQPEGYVAGGPWWARIPDQPEAAIDFPLVPVNKSNSFTFIHASDTHVSEQSLERLERLRIMTDSLKPAFVLVTGDLIKDALRVPEQEATKLYEMYRSAIGKFSVPVWNVPGNHELFGIERHKSLVSEKHALYGKKMYRHFLGPDYYSFNYGGLHFIGLNSVDYHDLWYYGHIDSLQMAWIKKDVSTVSKTKPIITFNHIPFFSGGMGMAEYTDGEPGSTLIT